MTLELTDPTNPTETRPMFVVMRGAALQLGYDLNNLPYARFIVPGKTGQAPDLWREPPTAFLDRDEAEFWANTFRRRLSVTDAMNVQVSFSTP